MATAPVNRKLIKHDIQNRNKLVSSIKKLKKKLHELQKKYNQVEKQINSLEIRAEEVSNFSHWYNGLPIAIERRYSDTYLSNLYNPNIYARIYVNAQDNKRRGLEIYWHNQYGILQNHFIGKSFTLAKSKELAMQWITKEKVTRSSGDEITLKGLRSRGY